MEMLLYGLPKNETERYAEVLLATQCRSSKDVDAAKAAASKDGFHSFRVATFNWEKPDFSKAVTI